MRFLILLVGNICLARLLIEDFNNIALWVVFVALGLMYVTGELK